MPYRSLKKGTAQAVLERAAIANKPFVLTPGLGGEGWAAIVRDYFAANKLAIQQKIDADDELNAALLKPPAAKDSADGETPAQAAAKKAADAAAAAVAAAAEANALVASLQAAASAAAAAASLKAPLEAVDGADEDSIQLLDDVDEDAGASAAIVKSLLVAAAHKLDAAKFLALVTWAHVTLIKAAGAAESDAEDVSMRLMEIAELCANLTELTEADVEPDPAVSLAAMAVRKVVRGVLAPALVEHAGLPAQPAADPTVELVKSKILDRKARIIDKVASLNNYCLGAVPVTSLLEMTAERKKEFDEFIRAGEADASMSESQKRSRIVQLVTSGIVTTPTDGSTLHLAEEVDLPIVPEEIKLLALSPKTKAESLEPAIGKIAFITDMLKDEFDCIVSDKFPDMGAKQAEVAAIRDAVLACEFHGIGRLLLEFCVADFVSRGDMLTNQERLVQDALVKELAKPEVSLTTGSSALPWLGSSTVTSTHCLSVANEIMGFMYSGRLLSVFTAFHSWITYCEKQNVCPDETIKCFLMWAESHSAHMEQARQGKRLLTQTSVTMAVGVDPCLSFLGMGSNSALSTYTKDVSVALHTLGALGRANRMGGGSPALGSLRLAGGGSIEENDDARAEEPPSKSGTTSKAEKRKEARKKKAAAEANEKEEAKKDAASQAKALLQAKTRGAATKPDTRAAASGAAISFSAPDERPGERPFNPRKKSYDPTGRNEPDDVDARKEAMQGLSVGEYSIKAFQGIEMAVEDAAGAELNGKGLFHPYFTGSFSEKTAHPCVRKCVVGTATVEDGPGACAAHRAKTGKRCYCLHETSGPKAPPKITDEQRKAIQQRALDMMKASGILF